MNVVDPMHRLGLLDHGDVEIHDDRRLPAAHQSAVECPAAFVEAWDGFVRSLS